MNEYADLPLYETELQRIWAEQDFNCSDLLCVSGEAVEILFPGWLNRDRGADFQAARIRIGNDLHFGAVEVHMQSSGWFSHRHHCNPDYNSVVLHVVLYHQDSRPVTRDDGRAVPELELAPRLNRQRPESQRSSKRRLRVVDQLPGRCGVWMNEHEPGEIRKLLGHAAEQRMQNKMQALLERMREEEPEELLFQLIFKSLGYTTHAQAFSQLACLFPYTRLRPLLRQSPREARTTVLSRWFGSCGLLETGKLPDDSSVRREFLHWREQWELLPEQPQVFREQKVSSRPWSSMERRLLGMFHHLMHVCREGLLKCWLLLLRDLDRHSGEADLRRLVLSRTGEFFETPDWEVWKTRYGFRKGARGTPAQLVGRDRQVIVWANAILPFFLAHARLRGDLELERLLYRVFMILPPEPLNWKTRFMENRLWLASAKSLKVNTFGYRQGMLQMHADFCRNFHQGCSGCELVAMLQSF